MGSPDDVPVGPVTLARVPGWREKREARERELFDDPNTIEEIIEHIAEGNGLVDWCRTLNVRYAQIVAWIKADPSRRSRVEEADRARAAKAAYGVESIARRILQPHIKTGHDWVDEMAPDVDPKALRVAMGGLQWIAIAGDRERFGTRAVQHSHTHKLADDHLAALRAASRAAGAPALPGPAEGTVRVIPVPYDGEFRELPRSGEPKPPPPDPSAFRVPMPDVDVDVLPAPIRKWTDFVQDRAYALRKAWALPALRVRVGDERELAGGGGAVGATVGDADLGGIGEPDVEVVGHAGDEPAVGAGG
jgi:hypothetical protein